MTVCVFWLANENDRRLLIMSSSGGNIQIWRHYWRNKCRDREAIWIRPFCSTRLIDSVWPEFRSVLTNAGVKAGVCFEDVISWEVDRVTGKAGMAAYRCFWLQLWNRLSLGGGASSCSVKNNGGIRKCFIRGVKSAGIKSNLQFTNWGNQDRLILLSRLVTFSFFFFVKIVLNSMFPNQNLSEKLF